MNSKINGRTPEEIKNGLEYCISESVLSCDECPYAGKPCDSMQMLKDALAYIQQLESERDQYRRERDAAVEIFRGKCDVCKYKYDCSKCEEDCETCACDVCFRGSNWQWRGLGVE